MLKRTRFIALVTAAFAILAASDFTRQARTQAEQTLVGEWIMKSTPIDNQLVSRLGNTLAFPDRHMVFEQQGDIRTGVVLREDAGANVHPLGVWRVMGDKFSATFQLWCPNKSSACGSVIMRGEFVRDDRVRGTMTVFFDQKDDFRPTGYDTWVFSFKGDRLTGGSN
ncbi:MAG TPA: hypothetical protein VJZ26_07690 [Blastocatellia bacterium]|nr:hypothetical protein [Blastocatellia bacterium]